jgi:hypothetical protein
MTITDLVDLTVYQGASVYGCWVADCLEYVDSP